MTLLSLIIGKKKNKTNNKAIILSGAFYLENLYFYQKSSMKELCNFISRQAISLSNKVGFTNIQHKGLYVVTLMKSSGIVICAVMDNDKYPIRVMHRLLNGILNDYIDQVYVKSDGNPHHDVNVQTKFQLPKKYRYLSTH